MIISFTNCLLSFDRHKKGKDSSKYSLDRYLLKVKKLVFRLPQNTSNVNIECVGKSKQLYSLCDQPL